MELVWSHLFTEKMRIDPHEKKVLLTDAPMNPRENRCVPHTSVME